MDVFTIVKRNPFVFPMACFGAAAIVFISEGSYRQSVETLDELGTMTTARTNIRDLQLGMLDAETAQRGYLLTNDKQYLEPYERTLKEFDQTFRHLESYLKEDSRQSELLGKLRTLADAKFSEFRLTIQLHDEGKDEEAKHIIAASSGKRQMDAIRTLSAELLSHESEHFKAGRGDLYQTLMISRIGLAALSVIGLLAMFFYLRQTFLVIEQQNELKRRALAERDRLEVEVVRRTAQLTELTHHLQTAREDERNRLARNLHDELGALLTSAKLDAARIKSRLAGTAPEAQERLSHLVETLNASIALGRSIIEDLRPSTLANLGLVPTLEILLREFADHSGTKVHAELHAVQLDHATELVVYRLVQEAITNLSKYARASQVWVSLGPREGRVEVSVRDDGVGFDANTPPRSAFGLAGMRFRIEAAGGSMTLVAAPEQGTQIQVSLPQSA